MSGKERKATVDYLMEHFEHTMRHPTVVAGCMRYYGARLEERTESLQEVADDIAVEVAW